MKTAKDIILYLIPNADNLMTANQFNNAMNAVKGYAKQAIKVDRINVAKHAKTSHEYSKRYDDIFYTIDQDSIINAPEIELL